LGGKAGRKVSEGARNENKGKKKSFGQRDTFATAIKAALCWPKSTNQGWWENRGTKKNGTNGKKSSSAARYGDLWERENRLDKKPRRTEIGFQRGPTQRGLGSRVGGSRKLSEKRPEGKRSNNWHWGEQKGENDSLSKFGNFIVEK